MPSIMLGPQAIMDIGPGHMARRVGEALGGQEVGKRSLFKMQKVKCSAGGRVHFGVEGPSSGAAR
jgi:hypothetical protein